jgi:hypothetical protein
MVPAQGIGSKRPLPCCCKFLKAGRPTHRRSTPLHPPMTCIPAPMTHRKAQLQVPLLGGSCAVFKRGHHCRAAVRANGNNRAPHTAVWGQPHSLIRSSAQGRKQSKPNKSLTARAGAIAGARAFACALTGQQAPQSEVRQHTHHACRKDRYSIQPHTVPSLQTHALQHAQPHQTAWLA